MPLIVGMNISPDADVVWRNTLATLFEEAAVSIPELELTTNDVTCFFPHDPSVPASAIPTIIVELLFDKPKRTHEVGKQLAEKLAGAFGALFPDRPVEVAVKRFDPDKDGFCFATHAGWASEAKP